MDDWAISWEIVLVSEIHSFYFIPNYGYVHFLLEQLSLGQIYSLLWFISIVYLPLHSIGYCSQSWVLLGEIPWLKALFSKSRHVYKSYLHLPFVLVIFVA